MQMFSPLTKTMFGKMWILFVKLYGSQAIETMGVDWLFSGGDG